MAFVRSSRAARPLPWVEKYRPRTTGEIAHQDEVVAALRRSLATQNLPHLLFYGPPGTGKTSTILAVARELYGEEHWRSRVLELNASDERGIRALTPKVKAFSQQALGARAGVPYKLVILDEADATTPFAQTALRRVIENYSRTTRFCLICNYVSRIIDPLASRCAKFRFRRVPREAARALLLRVCVAEGVPHSDALFDAISDASGGDLRKALQLLQSTYSAHGDALTPANVLETAGLVPRSVVDGLVEATESRDFARLEAAVAACMADAYPADTLIAHLFDRAMADSAVSDRATARIVDALAVAEHALIDGADEFLQLMNALSVWMSAVRSDVAAVS